MYKIIMIIAAITISLIYVSNLTVYAASDYQKGYKASRHNGLKDGVYHHDRVANSISDDWASGYSDGFIAGCVESGRSVDNCNVQADADTHD
jgi:hypothetical protein